jgi:hypothetical protein
MMSVACYLVSGSRVSFVLDLGSITILFSDTDIGCVIKEQHDYDTEIMNGRYTSQKSDNTR